MKWSIAIAVCCALILSAFVTVRAEEKTPASESKSDAKPVKLVKPWNKLATLTDEQKTKIADIHKKATEEINAIKKKEQADITALLTDEQKAELKSVIEKDSGDKKNKKADEAAAAVSHRATLQKQEAGEKKEAEAK
jgi:Spy/CpxP family protein refolding chaperone